jgi:hypothetical protein
MAHPAVLLVFLVMKAGDTPLSDSLYSSVHAILGDDTKVSIVMLPERPSDDALLARAGSETAIVEVWWLDPGQHTAFLHCFEAGQQRWVDRQITFDPSDAARERGRTIGFALGSMFDGTELLPAPQHTHEASIQRAPVSELSAFSASLKRESPSTHALELAGIGSVGFGGTANGFGALGSIEAQVYRSLWLGAGLGARFGDIPSAQATSRDLFLQGEISWRPDWLARSSYRVSFRAELAASWLVVSHLSADDPKPDNESRLLGLGRALTSLSWGITNATALFTALGPEVAFGQTRIYTHNSQVATIPAFRGFAALGIRTGF